MQAGWIKPERLSKVDSIIAKKKNATENLHNNLRKERKPTEFKADITKLEKWEGWQQKAGDPCKMEFVGFIFYYFFAGSNWQDILQ